LKTIYATHGHGDHWFGAKIVLEHFPDAKFVSSPKVVARMRQQILPKFKTVFEKKLPNEIPNQPIIAEELKSDRFQLEGHDLIVIDTDHTDMDDTTAIYVPDIGLVVAGDVVYNEVHMHLSQSTTPELRQKWISALDKISALNSLIIIAGHKWLGNEDTPKHIEASRQYIRDFSRLAKETKTAKELFDKMIELYPYRINRGALWDSARAEKTGTNKN
jgi:glyoxylase-like metal-dependent hydrolase (beta-lactamase superfamily II)